MIRRLKNIAHAIEAEAASIIYGTPSRKISTIGVTGTDGKTTTTSLIFHILKESGLNPAMVTTVGAQIGSKEYETGLHTTTPSSRQLQKYIKKAVDNKSDYLVLEVTSHALDQERVRGIDFKIGVLTNISHEHLDYHKTYESYVATKAKLFKKANVAILNKDDKSYELIKKYCIDKKVYTYSVRGEADINLKSSEIKYPEGFEFNYENYLAATFVAKLVGVSNEDIQKAILTFKYPQGRQEIVYDKEFEVVIDFAHTPNSFAKILPGLKKEAQGRLIHVFGCASKRDISKRPLMGRIATDNDDIVVLTAEDPRGEPVSDINRQIKMGMTDFKDMNPDLFNNEEGKFVFEIADRQDAIDFAVKIAKPGDVIVTTGKGHERSMNLGHGEVPWSEHEAIQKAIELRSKN